MFPRACKESENLYEMKGFFYVTCTCTCYHWYPFVLHGVQILRERKTVECFRIAQRYHLYYLFQMLLHFCLKVNTCRYIYRVFLFCKPFQGWVGSTVKGKVLLAQLGRRFISSRGGPILKGFDESKQAVAIVSLGNNGGKARRCPWIP